MCLATKRHIELLTEFVPNSPHYYEHWTPTESAQKLSKARRLGTTRVCYRGCDSFGRGEGSSGFSPRG
jgi:hypothetical protein